MLGVLGGALAFGLLGVFLGPVLLGVGYTLVNEWAGEPLPVLTRRLDSRPGWKQRRGSAARLHPGRPPCPRWAARAMIIFILSRLLQAIPVLLVVGSRRLRACSPIVGDPVTVMLGQDYTEAQRVALVHELGLDRPFFVQYATLHVGGAARQFRHQLPAGRSRSPT